MKKFLAVVMAAIMLLAVVPFSASAAVANDDYLINTLMTDDNFYHLTYAKEKKFFKNEIAAYTALGLYDGAWENFFTGSVDKDYAKTILLALVDRFEAEYNNETYEEIIGVLKGAGSVAGLIEKVDEYTNILGLAESAEWATSLGVLNTAVKALNMTNELYEQYVEGYAIILSCQAASVYYGDFLAYLQENCENEDVKAAAADLAENITSSLEESRDKLIKALAADAAAQSTEIGVNLAMDAYGVTAVIKTVYNTIGNIGDKLFNTADQYQCMASLAIVSSIEDVVPAYVKEVMAGEDETARDFAISALMTIRETGESTLLNLGLVADSSLAGKIFQSYNKTTIKNNAAAKLAELSVIRDIVTDETATYKTASIQSAIGKKEASVYNAENILIVKINDGKESYAKTENGVFASIHNDSLNTYVKVVVLFEAGADCTVQFKNVASTGSSTGTGSTSTGGGFFASLSALFSNLFKSLSEIFKNLFKFGK